MNDPMRADAGADATGQPDGPPAGTWVAPDGRTVAHAESSSTAGRERRGDGRSGAVVGGVVLILVGGYFLLRQALPAVDLGFWWPLVSVVVGVILVVLAIRPRGSAGSSGT